MYVRILFMYVRGAFVQGLIIVFGINTCMGMRRIFAQHSLFRLAQEIIHLEQ